MYYFWQCQFWPRVRAGLKSMYVNIFSKICRKKGLRWFTEIKIVTTKWLKNMNGISMGQKNWVHVHLNQSWPIFDFYVKVFTSNLPLNTIILHVGTNIFSDFLTNSKCKGACGTKGTQLRSWMDDCLQNLITKEIRCNPESFISNYTPCEMEACPQGATYQPWSDWTKCSLKCLKNLSDRGEMNRTRTCENCGGEGLVETKDCIVDLCLPECPR